MLTITYSERMKIFGVNYLRMAKPNFKGKDLYIDISFPFICGKEHILVFEFKFMIAKKAKQ